MTSFKNSDLPNALNVICCLPKGKERRLALYQIAEKLFPGKNTMKWLDEANDIEDDVKRRIYLDDFFASLQLAGSGCSLNEAMVNLLAFAKGKISRVVDIVNIHPEEARRNELFDRIFLKEDQDTLEIIKGLEALTERREFIRDVLSK